jgi:hypothetical protein
MPRATRNKAMYDKIVEGYRLFPGLHQKAGDAAGVDVKTAKKAWEEGWPRFPWGEPIEAVIRREGNAERVARAEAARRHREAEAAEADRRRGRIRTAIEREEELITEASKGVKAAALTVQNLVPAVASCLKQLKDATMDGAPKLSTRECRAIVDLFVKVAGRVTYATDSLVKLSRLDRGASTLNIGEPSTDPDEGSLADSIEELEAASEILKQYKASTGAQEDEDGKELH